MSKSEPGMAE